MSKGRHIPRETILDAVDTYELVESYPQDKYLPSYLVLAYDGSEAFHVLFATDVAEEHVRVVTILALAAAVGIWLFHSRRLGAVVFTVRRQPVQGMGDESAGHRWDVPARSSGGGC